MAAFFQTVWQSVTGFFSTFNWIIDTLDILVVALVVYFIIRLVRDSRAEQLLRGILFLGVLYLVAYLFGLTTVSYLLNAVFDNGLLLLVVVFQPEVRRALEQAGHSRGGLLRILGGFNNVNNAAYIDQWNKAIEATADAVEILQKQKMGALIVMERTTRLGEIVRSGTIMEAEPSAELISTVFFNKAPLHDGAMIIREGKIYAAACILPLTENLQISRELGTRHRAGVGMSENSDAIVVILSEETGMVSLAEHGELQRNFTRETLVKALSDRILWSQEDALPVGKRKKGRGNRGEKE
ncbi:MAG: diadenylate cyclase CdaA [Clostridia bacterium]|nr:diadenylate cyclase CdaA [Clostridia bacterium]